MARKFSLGEHRINFNKFKDAIKTKWNVGNARRKPRTDTNLQNLKDDFSRALNGDVASLKRVKEYTLKRSQRLKESVPKEEFHYLQDADFIHQILTVCDEISPAANVFDPRKGIPIKKINSAANVLISKPNLNPNEKNELYILSVITHDLISLEESRKSPINVSKVEPGMENILALMQDVLQLPKGIVKSLEDSAHQGSEYGFSLIVSLHQAQNNKTPNAEFNQATLYCRVGYMSKEAVEQKKFDLEGKGTHVQVTQSVTESQNPVWEEQYKLPLISKTDYLLIELWRSKAKKKNAKSSDEFLCRCLIRLDAHMEEVNEQLFELLSSSGKVTQWTVLLSMKIIASVRQLSFIVKYNTTQKLEIYRSFICELTQHLHTNKYSLNFDKYVQPFERIRNKLVEMLELNNFQVRTIAFECAELWSKSKRLSSEEIEMCIGMLNSYWEKTENILSQDQRTRLIKQICNLLEQEMKRLEYLLTEFPPTQLESLQCVHTLVSIIFGTYTFLLNRTSLEFMTNYDTNYDINNDITKRLIKGINTWYKDTSQEVLVRTTHKTQLESLVLLCDSVLLLMESSDRSYKDAISAASIDYSNLIVFTIDKQLSKEIEETTKLILVEDPKHGEDHNQLYFMIFLLYRKVALIMKKIALSKSAVESFKLNCLHDWFRPFLNHWVVALREVSMRNIQTTIEIETDETHEYKGIKCNSSVIDIALCVLPSYLFYNKLEGWVDIQDVFYIALQIIQLNVDALLTYGQKMSERACSLVNGLNSFELTSELCVLLNNCYCTIHYHEEISERMHLEKLKSFLEEEVERKAIDQLLNGCLDNIDTTERENMRTIGKSFKAQFSVFYAEFISTPQLVEDAIDSLMKWLLSIINIANQDLSPDLFIPLLEEMWRRTLECIAEYKDPTKSKGYSNKILESLVILYQFFDNDGRGIGTEKTDGTIYDSLIEHFSLYLQDSHELMLMFGRDVAEFCRCAPVKRGSCNYSVAYLIDKEVLEVNIIQIANIPSPNTSGSVSLYLQATVLPKYLETKSLESKTELKKYEESMVLDESISIPVAKVAVPQGYLLQISLYYRSSHKMGLYSEYGGSIFLTSDYVGQMKSTGSLVDLLSGRNEVRKPIKMSFIDPGESEILGILRERRHEDTVINNFIESVTKGVKEGSTQSKVSEGVEGTRKFLNKFRK